MKILLIFGFITVCLIHIGFSAPINDNEDILANSETRNYRYPFYWFVRPIYADEDYETGNEELPVKSNKRRTSTISLTAVGAGWGR